MKVFATAFVVLLIFMIMLVSVPSVRAAIQRWIGYVPGMGLVNEGQIRMLEEPVSVTRDGITLTVKEMWVASDQTVIQYAVEGFSLAIDRAVQMDDGYLIYVTLHYENTGLDWIDTPDPTLLHLLDTSRQAVSYEQDWEATMGIETTAGSGKTAFAIKPAPIQTHGTLPLVLDSISANMAADANFTFDPGPNPTPGQVWELNQDLDVGHGHSLQVLKVTYDLTDGVQAYLSFNMESKTGITYAFLFDEAHPLTAAGGGDGGASAPGPFTSDLYYLEPMPQGPLTASITGVSFLLPGYWQAEWTPPKP